MYNFLFKDIDEENSFYDFLKNCRLAESLEALRELDFIARTSCKEFQKQKKERQMREIESSISSFLAENDNIHRTFTPNTNITVRILIKIFFEHLDKYFNLVFYFSFYIDIMCFSKMKEKLF